MLLLRQLREQSFVYLGYFLDVVLLFSIFARILTILGCVVGAQQHSKVLNERIPIVIRTQPAFIGSEKTIRVDP
jgi:hypothetical protein